MSSEAPKDYMLLIATIGTSGETVTMQSPMHSLPELLETFERFIRASGYNPNGVLDFINEDTETSTTGRTST